MHELCQSLHEVFVSLHSSSSINEQDIIALALGFLEGLLGNNCRVILVALLIEGDVQAGTVSLKLLNGTRSEVITTSNHDLKITLGFQVVSNLGKRCGFSNTIDSNKYSGVNLTTLLGSECVLQEVDVLLWS